MNIKHRMINKHEGEREGQKEQAAQYCFIPTNFSVIRNVAFNKFTPDYWVVISGFEELCDVIGPSINSIKPLLAEHTGEVSLNG